MTESDMKKCIEQMPKIEAGCPNATICVTLNSTEYYRPITDVKETRIGWVHWKPDGVLIQNGNI